MKKIEENRNMKMKESLLAALLGALVLLLCACGESKVDYPALDAPDLDTMTLSEVANGSVRAKYDASEWLADPSIDPLTFYYLADTSDEENMVNINVNFLLSGVKRLTEDDMSDMLAEVEGEYSNELTIQEKRMCSLDGSAAIYMEGTMQFTDKTIDLMIENGAFTQEEIDAIGGRDVLLSVPPVSQLYIFSVNGGDLFICTGTYFSADQKADVLEGMTVLARTAESVT